MGRLAIEATGILKTCLVMAKKQEVSISKPNIGAAALGFPTGSEQEATSRTSGDVEYQSNNELEKCPPKRRLSRFKDWCLKGMCTWPPTSATYTSPAALY